MRQPKVVVFDSGLGGLSILAEIRKARPDADIVYVADDAGFPYGAWDARALAAHVLVLMDDLIPRHSPDLVVIACNTASTLVLAPLRARYAIDFVGTVPAIKLAAATTKTGLISVLATPGTVKRDYTRALIDDFAGEARVTLVGSERLAGYAEATLAGATIADTEIQAEIAPCFRQEGIARTDTIVLACTHYPFLLESLIRLAPWPVAWLDPAPAVARRVASLLETLEPRLSVSGSGMARFTSGRSPGEPSLAVLRKHGLRVEALRFA